MKAGNMRNFSNTLYPKHTHRKKEGEKKAFSTSQINHYIAPCRRLSGWYLVPCVINTDKKKKNPTHTSSGVIFTSSTLRMFQPANLPPPPPKKGQDKKRKKKGESASVFPYVNYLNKCVQREGKLGTIWP